MNKVIQTNKKSGSPTLAYLSFLFATCLRRPFSYITVVLYLLYLSTILLIVPACLKLEPLFIWSNTSFNMQIFNLFFVAAVCSALAVAVFRTGREDGTDLNLSSKPLRRGQTILCKTLVYIVLILLFSALTLTIAAGTLAFGELSTSNPTGIEMSKFWALFGSMAIGNVVNMLIFGSFAILICIFGGSVVTMIATIGIAFLLSALNFLYPRISQKPATVLDNKYNSLTLSYSLNTLDQYESKDDECLPYTYVTLTKFDTNEYWNKAVNESNSYLFNYIDLGKQWSMLYASFGLEGDKLEDAQKRAIGSSISYRYDILPETNIVSEMSLKNKKYPICIYDVTSQQGVRVPVVRLVTNYLSSGSIDNWNNRANLFGVDFNSMCHVSSSATSFVSTDRIREQFNNRAYHFLSELKLTDKEKAKAREMYDVLETITEKERDDDIWQHYAWSHISSDKSGVFFEPGKWRSLNRQQMYDIVSKIQMYWMVYAQEKQIAAIHKYNPLYIFPFSDEQIIDWYVNNVGDRDSKKPDRLLFRTAHDLYTANMPVDALSGENNMWSHISTDDIRTCNVFNNLYQYKVSNFYSIPAIVAIWGSFAVILFGATIVVYRKIDFK